MEKQVGTVQRVPIRVSRIWPHSNKESTPATLPPASRARGLIKRLLGSSARVHPPQHPPTPSHTPQRSEKGQNVPKRAHKSQKGVSKMYQTGSTCSPKDQKVYTKGGLEGV
eukprot:1191602-Prorocentrum_minimum.AAC.5